ncbi:TraR/DksA family transcriptional regulator [Geobacter sp.]|uniref:TraR/DksA family transcriptional regulator n=1 Tax=Geobacter sp. TaxID=46610 RepID=UPI002625CE7F|nr:TraR/DksA family transcriptional regulator [Geobacter sp.]
MPDDIDRAQEINEQFLEDALAEHRRRKPLTVADSALICIDCETPIPEKRRKAAPGCVRCVECQTLLEHWRPL